ncbi:hypothetical protein AKJ16_DCAP23247 [Drosera capensis]
MDFIDTLRQSLMPLPHQVQHRNLQKPISISIVFLLCLAILVSTIVSLTIVFPRDNSALRPFCRDLRVSGSSGRGRDEVDVLPGAFYLTDQETVDYYYMVLFLPTALVAVVAAVYLIAGMSVAYSAPRRHGCLKVVENNYCASRRGGVRCLAILNTVFAIILGILAIFLGSSLLTLGSSCSLPLFWCYEIATWGLVVLHGGTTLFLRRKAALILDEGGFSRRNLGVEMLEASTLDISSDVERRVNEGFRTWMGSSLLSSDEEDELDSYLEAPHVESSFP